MSEEALSHLHAPYRPYALLPASERIQWIRQDRWIHYPRAEQVLNRLAELLTYPARGPHAVPASLRCDRHGEDPDRAKVPPRPSFQL